MFVMRPSKEKLCFPAFPFALPQLPAFREITRTQGVDQYTLNYHDYCHGRGSATQVTADSIEALGMTRAPMTCWRPTRPSCARPRRWTRS